MAAAAAVPIRRLDKYKPGPQQDSLLARRAGAGDEVALNTLIHTYWPIIHKFVYRMIRDKALAEDLAQKTFIRLFKHVRTFNPERSMFSTWLHTIAYRITLNEIRNRGRREKGLFSVDNISPSDRPYLLTSRAPLPDEIVHLNELEVIMWDTIKMLSNDHRAVFVLRELEERRYDEMVEILRIPSGTVKSRLNRARIQFITLVNGRHLR